jgi:hypothetical protein
MSTKATPESQFRALFVRDTIAALDIEYPNQEDDRFRQSMVLRIIEIIEELEPTQITRLNESACKADAKHSGVAELRHAIRLSLGKRYDLKGARKRAAEKNNQPKP